ncbi:hypothetical protein B0O80DRAFT_493320 [Mortierella sp. GBAus27b]|nr:hypothetical protein B0O80DRAFT_493320 [Mortierella sp. GBAus27b]
MANEKDKGAAGKDALDLYDDTDELLDYGDDAYDLDADLLDADLGDVENYGDLDFGAEDDLAFDAPLDSSAKNTATTTSRGDTSKDTHDTQDSKAVNSAIDSSDKDSFHETLPSDGGTDSSSNNKRGGGEFSSDHASGYNNQQLTNGRPPYSASSTRGGRGGMRGRGGQNYGGGGGGGGRGMGMGMGRGNFQGRPGMGQPNMMGMNMGMGMNPIGQNMNMNVMQMMGMGMGMNMNMGMGMNMGGPRFPGDGYGNQGMMYPYAGGQGMGGMNARGPGIGAPGRTIHINPKFQNRPGMPPIPGMGIQMDPQQQQQSQQQQQQQQPSQYHQQQRPSSQDANRGQTRTWENKHSESGGHTARSSGGYDERDSDRHDNAQRSYGREDNKGNSDRYNSGSNDHGDQSSGNIQRPSARSERDVGLTTKRISDRLSSGNGDFGSNGGGGGGATASITSRLTPGLKRSGDNLEDSYKALKSSGGSTPRSEQIRTSEKDTGSISFLRDKRDSAESSRESGGGGGSNAEPKGFVKMDNVPDSLTDQSIRKLADGISGVDRVLTISKKGNRTVVLGFASVDEAKFFRRQINRTTIEGSLVTVTLTSS